MCFCISTHVTHRVATELVIYMFRCFQGIDFLSWGSAEICWAKFSQCQSYSLIGWDPFGSCINIASGFQAVTVSRRAQSYIRKVNTSWNRDIFWLEKKTYIKFFKWWTGNSPLKKKKERDLLNFPSMDKTLVWLPNWAR